jgi:hypothetical protein
MELKNIKNINMKNNFSFILSTRFWALVGIAIVGALKAWGTLSEEVANGLITILTGYTIVRSLDRSVDKLSK